MKYSYATGKEESTKDILFYRKENGVRAHELVEVSIRATGEKRQEILEMAEKAKEELFKNIKELLEKGDSKESPQ